MLKLSQLGEFGLIDLLKKQVGSVKAIKGIGDDAAVLPLSKDKYFLLTTDMLVEGVHFTKKMNAESIGHKAMACSISDIAAMGGLPKYAVISLGVSGNVSLKFIQDVYKGINRCAKKFGISIVGGDTVKSDKLIINVALTGEVKKEHLVKRNSARVGDRIFVTGPLGRSFKTNRHLNFTPRVNESQYLVQHCKPSSMIDVSDGLAGDLGHILKQSNVGAVIYEDQIPRRNKASLKESLYDGEDYELLFTLPASKDRKFIEIGKITDKKGLFVVNRAGEKFQIKSRSFTHF